MTLFTRDLKYEQGKKLVDDLEGDQGDLIRYFVEENERHYKRQQDRIDEMQKVFEGIRRFTHLR